MKPSFSLGEIIFSHKILLTVVLILSQVPISATQPMLYFAPGWLLGIFWASQLVQAVNGIGTVSLKLRASHFIDFVVRFSLN